MKKGFQNERRHTKGFCKQKRRNQLSKTSPIKIQSVDLPTLLDFYPGHLRFSRLEEFLELLGRESFQDSQGHVTKAGLQDVPRSPVMSVLGKNRGVGLDHWIPLVVHLSVCILSIDQPTNSKSPSMPPSVWRIGLCWKVWTLWEVWKICMDSSASQNNLDNKNHITSY